MPSTTFSRSPPNSSAWHWQFSMTWLLPHLTICQSHTQPNPWKNSLLPTTGLLHLLLLCLESLVPTPCHLANTPSSPKVHFKYLLRAKGCSNCCTIALISHASKLMLRILQARFQQYMNYELPDVQAGFRKGRGMRDQLLTSVESSKEQKSSRKHLLLLYWLHQCLWLCGSERTVENSSRDGNTRPPYLPPEKSVCR